MEGTVVTMEPRTGMNRRKHQQQQDMLRTMNSFRKSRTFCDVFLVVENGTLPAHKVVLAANSSFFKASFTFELTKEKSTSEVEVNLRVFYLDGMEELLNFIYTGECGVSEKNAEQLLAMADYFDIPSLKETCAEFLMISLKPSNCLWIQVFAKRYNHELLYEAATEYICNNLSSIWKTNEFLCFDFIDVEELICGERLVIKTQRGEEEVFEGIRAWVKHDSENRENFFEDLFRHVRLSAMSIQFISEFIECDELVTQSHDSQSLVTAALRIPDEARDEPRGVTESIVLLSKNGCCSCFTPATGMWYDLARLPSFNEPRAITICEGLLFAIGWQDDRLTIENFDPQINTWSEVLSTLTNLPTAAVSVDDSIFLLKENGLTRFKPVDHSWEDMAPMDSSRRGLCAVSLNGLVYAIGGHDGLRQLGLNIVERYDPQRDQWEYVSPMDERRAFASATVTSNKIFVVGGTGDHFLPLQNCELYDPITNMWSLLSAELCVPRSHAALGKAKRKIFVFGGTYSNGIVEYFDRENEAWTEIGKMPSTLSYNHACVTWLPKAMLKSLRGSKLLCDQQKG
ncbi:kelch-like protein diablo [Stylophora pistillata]|uniref:kelch-like protein diablo n=1 Tax=Stylophora pistillata TaxID=50429 RepID=UPI000C03B1D9|nr:kelch-like protein diablo [Stylophora pistillata]